MQTQSAAQLAEGETRKRQVEATQFDCKRLCVLDNNTPFVDGKDAFDRLIPWHVLGADDDLDTDLDEKEASELAKHEAWLEACHSNTVRNIERLQATATRLGLLPAGASPSKAGTVVEKVLLERLLLADERARFTEERDKVQLEQLRQTTAPSQRGLQSTAQPAQAAFQPGIAAPQLPQPVQHSLAWPSSVPASNVAEQALKSPATASGFRSFSITGRAKPPT